MSDHRAHEQDAYGLALLLVIVSVLLAISFEPRASGPITGVIGLLQAGALITVLRVSGVSRRRFTLLAVTITVLALGSIALTVSGSVDPRLLMLPVLLLLALGAQIAVVKRLAGYRRVDVRLVLGLLVIYVLLGVEFAYAYLLVDRFVVGAFSDPLTLSSAEYLSFITLATVGFGDIAPVAGSARALAVAEAVFGQLYLVSVVSIAVGSFGRQRTGPGARQGSEDAGE